MKRSNDYSYKIIVKGGNTEEIDYFFVDTLEEGAKVLNETFFSSFPVMSRCMLSNYCFKQESGLGGRISVFKERVRSMSSS